MKERNYSFDIMRVLACIMIICMHAPMPSENAIGLFNVSLCYFTEPGLCLFFVISGALLLPTLTFTGIYLLLRLVFGDDVEWLTTICSIPFSAQGHGVLWFMYTLIGLYLIAPVISKWLSSVSKREEEFYLSLWCITLCYPLMKRYLSINDSETGIFILFQGYLGYFVLGHYLKNYANKLKMKLLALPVMIAITAPVVSKLLHLNVDMTSTFGYLSIFIAILCVAYFKIGSRIGNKLIEGKFTNFIALSSNLSFGIYLIHIAVMRYLLWKMDFIIDINNYILQTVIIIVLTFTISWLCTYIISFLPFGDYIIGYKRKK